MALEPIPSDPLAPRAPAPECRRLLLVDDDGAVRHAYARMLRRLGFDVVALGDGAEALAALAAGDFDLVLSDIALPGASGLDLLRAARQRDPDLPVILVTGGAELETAVKAVELGALRYLLKPLDLDALRAAITEGVRLRQVARLRQAAFEHYGRLERQGAARADLGQRFERALATLYMDYQPIVFHSRRSTAAYEALARNHEESLRRPDLLFAAAEELGRLPELGRAIRASVAQTIAATAVGRSLFVNLHPLDLADDELFDPAAPLSRVARQVVLEITERAALGGQCDLTRKLEALRRLGYRLAVDDLGAGYAGLSSFAMIHPDAVKLDMSLTRGIDADPTKQKLVRSMAELCGELKILVVAEGVETAAERDALGGLGCELMQGYLFARPGPPFPPIAWNGAPAGAGRAA